MIEDYSKKVVDSSSTKKEVIKPKKKVFQMPKDWQLYEKREIWCVRRPDGQLRKFANENAAKLYIEEMS